VEGEEKENLNQVAFLVLRVNLVKGEFRGSVLIGFIDIA
jgi:hypothetical protein